MAALIKKKIHVLASKKFDNFQLDLYSQFETDQGDEFIVADTFSDQNIKTDDPYEQFTVKFLLGNEKTKLIFSHNAFKTNNFYELNRLANGINKRSGDLSALAFQYKLDWQSLDSSFWLGYTQSNLSTRSQLTAKGQLFDISKPASNEALIADAKLNNNVQKRAQWHNNWQLSLEESLQFGIEARFINIPTAYAKNNFNLSELVNKNYPISYYGKSPEDTPVQLASDRDILGIYTQYQNKVFKDTQITLGVRYDDFSSIGSHVSPRVALVTQLNQFNSLKLLYGEAFRAPTENELNLVNNPVIRGNIALKPESVHSSEIIWLGQWHKTGVSIGYFESHFSDSILQKQTSSGLQYINTEQDDAKGLEFELSQEINKSVLIKATYTHLNKKYDFSSNEATNLSSIVVNYHKNKFNINVMAWYQGQRDMQVEMQEKANIKLDSYWLVSSKIKYKVLEKADIYLQAKNVFDKKYFTPFTNALSAHGVINRGREIIFGIMWQF